MSRRPLFEKLIALTLVLAIVGGLWYFLAANRAQLNGEPFEARDENSSRMFQDEPLTLNVDNPNIAPEDAQNSTEPEPSASPEPTEQPAETLAPLITPKPAEQTAAPDTETQPDATSPTGSGGEISPLVTPRYDETANEGKGENTQATQKVYFTTNIINGATLPYRELSVQITHKRSDLIVLDTRVEPNGSEIQFNGNLLLNEGKNTIRITVTYEGAEGHQIEVSKTYTVYVELKKLVITTDLRDMTINQRSFDFTAYASIGSRPAQLTVVVNGTEISASGNHYKTTLYEGDNGILLYASEDGQQEQMQFNIRVELPEGMEITTDLYDHEVDDPEFRFYAALSGGTGRATLTVVSNGETLIGSGGDYSCTLARGNNVIRLKASDVDGAEYTQTYTIAYHRYIVMNAEDADETMPTIYTNIYDGMEITGNRFTLQVRGSDGNGERLYGDHLAVQLNGTTLEDRGEDGSVTYYELNLIGGRNDVEILVWDYEDRYTFYRFNINCNEVPEGERIGSVTVSVEASTVGLGYLIPPMTVDIYQGQNLVVPVATALEENGFKYQYSGTLTDGFYLAHLIKDGITSGYSIPPDLAAAIDEDGLMWLNVYHENSLGEFDFTQGSGWMYSLNGQYVGRSMSEVYPQDGDVVRLRYTLAYGMDVGLGMDGKNYYKEW